MQAFSRVAVHMGSLVVVCRLSCPEASRPGIEPASPAFKGGFLTTGPTGKSHNTVLLTVVTMLYIRSLECVLLKTENMYPLTCITLFSPSCKSLATTIAFSVSMKSDLKKKYFRDFPGGPVVKNLLSNAGDMGSILGWGTKIPHAIQCGQNVKKLKIFVRKFPYVSDDI